MPNPEVKTIGKYEIQAELGHGGFGIVYRAFDPTVGRPVAIKILTVEGNRDVLTRFRNEATSAGNLRHRNIVTVHDYGEFNGRPYLVMELLEGHNLADIIASGANLTLLEKMTIMDQVADGLECAHRNGVVHRDVKPGNIQLLPDGTVKIMDFGIARVDRDREATRLTQQGDLIGTILYMSPEQFGGADADALCDIFAYGVTYFEFLTGKHPFRSADPRAVMFKITVEETPSVRSIAPDCPEGLDLILNRALQKDRELRYHNLRDLRLDAEPLILELKQEKAVELVADAHKLSDGKEPQKAIAIINEALDLDPANREARQLREVIQRQLQKEALQPRINALIQTAEEQLAKRSYAMAVQTLEGALRLDQTDTRIRGALDNAREQLQNYKDAAKAAIAAVSDMNRGEWASASAKANEAIALDPSNKEAARVLEAFGKYINSALSLVNSQIARREIDPALAGLKELEALQPGSGDIQKKLSIVEALKLESERIRSVLDGARRLLEEARFEEAVRVLWDPSLPDEPSVLELRKRADEGLAAFQRSQHIEKAAASIEALVDAADLDAAEKQIEFAIENFPNEKRLSEVRAKVAAARAARERIELRNWVIENFERLSRENRFADAIEIVQVGLRAYPDEPLFLDLYRKAEEQAEKARRAEAIRAAEEEGQRFLAESRFRQAVELLQRAVAEFPEEESLRQLLGAAVAEQQAHDRREAIGKALAEAQNFAARQNFDPALLVLDEALKQWPDEAELSGAREEVVEQRANWERQSLIQEITRQSNELTRDKRFESALAAIGAGLEKYPGDRALLELQSGVQVQLAAARRAAAIEQRIAECRRLIKDNSAQAAVEALEKALQEYPGEPSLVQLLHETREQLLAEQRREAIGQAAREGKARLTKQDFEGAIQSLEKALERWPGENSLESLLKESREALARRQRERAARIEQQIATALRLLNQDDPRAAIDLLQKASGEFPEQAQFARMLVQAREKLAAYERRIAVDQAAREAEALSAQHDFEGAAQILAKALQSWPLDSRLSKLLQKTVDARAAWDREQAIAEISLGAEKLAAESQFAEALSRLQTGLQKYPNEPALIDTVKKVQARKVKAERARAAAIVSTLDQCRRLINDDQLEPAIISIEKAVAQFPGEQQFTGLLAQAKEKLAEKERQERELRAAAIRQQVDSAKQFLAQHKTQSAIESLEKALLQFPWENEIVKLLAQARQQIQAEERQAAIDEALREAQAREKKQDFDGAIQVLENALKSWPGEESLVKRAASVRAAKDRWEEQQRERQAAAIRQEIASIQDFLAQQKTQLAIEAVQNALRKYPGDEQLLEFLDRTQKQLAAEKRREAVAAIRKQCEQLDGVGQFTEALKRLQEALQSYPGEPALIELQRRVQQHEEQVRRERMEAIQQRVNECRQLVQQARFAQAIEAAQQAHRLFPDEPAIEHALKDAQARFQQWQQQQEIENIKKQAEGLLVEGKADVAIALIESRFAGAPELAGLLARARKEVDAKRRDALRQRATALGQEGRYQEALAAVDQAIQQFGTTSELQALGVRLRTEWEQEQRRQARKRDLESLLALERQAGTEQRKKRLKQLREQAQQLAGPYASDQEFTAVLVRIQGRIDSVVQPATGPRPIPRAWIGAGLGAIALITAAVFLIPQLREKPVASLVALEIRSDPPGAAVKIGDRSCTTPNCRMEVPPGSYLIQAQLKGFQPVEQTVVVDASKPASPVALTLQPLPQPPPTSTAAVATGTLLVETGIADALVFIDDVPRQRTDKKGTLRLDLDPNRYRIRVQKSDYQASPDQQLTKITAGATRKVSFKLTPIAPKVEAKAETPALPPPATPPVVNPPVVKTAPPEPTEDQEWDQVKNTTDPAQIQRFLEKYRNGSHATQAQSLLDDLAWKTVIRNDEGSLRSYLSRFPRGNHAGEANTALDTLAWNRVDKGDAQSLRAFIDQNPNSPHKQDAQNRIDQMNQQAQAAAESQRRAQQQQTMLRVQKQEIEGVVDNLGALIARKRWNEVKRIWRGVSPALEQARDELKLTRKGEVVINGDSASVDCDLTIQPVVGRRSPQVITEKVTLQRSADGHWSVATIAPTNQ